MQAIMMVAGKSTRTYPLTLTRPKPLLPVLNRPLIYYNLDQLVGICQEVILIVGYRKEMIESALGSGYKGMRLTYIEQKEQLGTGHAVLQASHIVDDKCIVMNGDDLFARNDILQLLEYNFAALAMPVEDPYIYGVYQVDERNLAVNLVEKPKEDIGNLANVGCYLFEQSIFSELEQTPLSERGEIELTSAVLNIAKKEPFHVVSLKNYWLPTGYPWDLLKTQFHFFSNGYEEKISGHIESQVEMDGVIQLGIGSLIEDGVVIEGPICIGSNTVIKKSCQIGPFTTIGNNVIVGENSQIENSILMDNCRIDANCKISHSVLGENVTFENNCIINDSVKNHATVKSRVKNQIIDTGLTKLGASIGDKVYFQENTQVKAGKKIWPSIRTQKNQIVGEDLQNC